MAKKTRNLSEKLRRRSKRKRLRKIKKPSRRAPKPKRYDPRLEMGFKHMRGGDSQAEAARKIGVIPTQLRTYVISTGLAERRDGKWHFKRDRRFRRMPLYADGKRVVVTVHNSKTASLRP